ncbi:MAG: GNAT family N-acetyltransferase [Methanotrichaceae archaeon]|nr:GNAT family N-acetyltransferase [Methanotrichaceae archaeon]
MIIRKAELNDLSDIIEIEELCFPEETAFPAGMLAYLICYAETMVACHPDIEGFISGFCGGNIGSIHTLDVNPKHRRKGIGSLLIKALEDRLFFQGAKLILLEVAMNNDAALGLYLKAGYSESELLKNYYGSEKHAVRMLKSPSKSPFIFIRNKPLLSSSFLEF